MKLLFFGSPSVAVPFLEGCLRAGHEIAAVITQPDKPSGRTLALNPPPVKEAALRRGLKVLQPERLQEVRAELEAYKADMAVVVAYGKMLGPKVLAATRLGFLNVHFSLLPKYRGAAPVQWSLIKGEKESGVTLFWIVRELDAGPVQRRAAIPVGPEEDTPALFTRLISVGVAELEAALADLAEGRLRREEQSGAPSLAPKLTSEDARLIFSMSAVEFHNRVRGLRAGPRAYLMLQRPDGKPPQRVTVLKTALESAAPAGPEGLILRVDGSRGFLVQCSVGRCWIVEVQPEGKKPLTAVDFLNGSYWKKGDRLVTVAVDV